MFRAKLGTGGGARGALGAGGGLGSSSGLWALARQILFSSGFCLGTFRRGLALGFLGEALGGGAGSLPKRAPPLGPLTRAGPCSSAAGDLLGDGSEAPAAELWRGHGASGPSRGGRLQPAEALRAREMGTTLRMISLSDGDSVRTGLGPRGMPLGRGAPGAASLGGFLFGAIASFPLAGLSLVRPPLQLGWLFPGLGAGAFPVGLRVGTEGIWLPPVSEGTEPSPPVPGPRAPSPGLESVPSEQSRVSEQSVASDM